MFVFLFLYHMQPLRELENRLNLTFKNLNLITQAFVHRSYLNENPGFALGHNERLEFLGDAVLELIVTEHLFTAYPEEPEGVLTNWRASLVNANILAKVGYALDLEQYLYLSKGESKDVQSKARNYILANTVEALIGAIYLDQGIAGASLLVHHYVLTELPHILENKLYQDPKSRFQELAQEKMGITPSYRVMDETGPDHDKQFTIGVYVHDECIGTGVGQSKQEAQVAAAQEALKNRGWE